MHSRPVQLSIRTSDKVDESVDALSMAVHVVDKIRILNIQRSCNEDEKALVSAQCHSYSGRNVDFVSLLKALTRGRTDHFSNVSADVVFLSGCYLCTVGFSTGMYALQIRLACSAS